MSDRPFASFVVVNRDGAAILGRCLEALARQSDQDFEVILVDNASSVPWEPSVPPSLAQKLSAIRNEANEGFSKANNQALARARGEWFVLVNNDATLREDFLAALRRLSAERAGCRLFAPKVLIEDFPDFLDSAGLGVFLDGIARCRGWQEPAGNASTPREVLGVAGAVAVVHREAWEDVGPLDEDFFLYLEDLDFDLRALWKGHCCLFAPDLVAWHKHSSTTGKHTAQKAYCVERNHVWAAVKNFPLPLLLVAPLYTCYRYALQAYAAAARRGITSSFVRSYTRAQLAGVLWRAYRDAALGLPAMWRKRREIMAGRRVSSWDFLRLVKRHRLSWRDFAFKD